MRLTTRELGIALVLLTSGISRLLDQLPQRVQELVAMAMIAISLAVFISVPYPDLRTWMLQTWTQATTVISGYAVGLALLLWLIYMKLRGRERHAYQALMLIFVFAVLASAARRNAAA